MITSWTYSEIMLVFPEIQPLSEKVIQTLTIPTHDEWRVYYDQEYQANVKEEINRFLVSNGLEVQAYNSNDFHELLEMPNKLKINTNQTNYVSMFDNTILPESLYESF